MKRYDIIHQTSSQMIGHLIKPRSLKTESLQATERSLTARLNQKTSCYRLEKCLSQEVGKRTFLATDIHSNLQTIVKLLLYYPDPQKKEIEETLLQLQEAGLQPYQLPATLPYIESFEVETALGPALALVKPLVKPYVQTTEQSISTRKRRKAALSSHQAFPVPQTAYADFKVSAVSDSLSIRCLESRICTGIVAEDAGESLKNWLLAVVGTVTFVGGAVAMTGSIAIGVFVAVLLPLLFECIITLEHKQRTVRRQAIIRLSRKSSGRTFLSLTTALMPKLNGVRKENAPLLESQLHYSRLSVKAVTVAPAFFFFLNDWNLLGAKLTFTFYNHDAPSPCLCVVGSYQEIRWIQRHLLRWAKADSPSA
ncbi:hypothetical protein S7335_1911 [Synechococcus sp. PCC 7335]|uniref:hypothetical protein n=1 Tax=Synechococcus sp. (strain ATCC 29403 / PCC 7335) TaxID=91464 RepID=UPI00017ED649|nr:hypothetical protein [Synechococcus sp. PCC 7335]EDX84214.1 hypothetical protein S7335_1911 [Synechococcus sp. PCC 7335]